MWPLWPTYLKIHGSFRQEGPAKHMYLQLANCSELKSGVLKWIVPLSDEDKLNVTCSHVVVLLEQVYNDIVSGEVTIQQLCEREEQKEQLVELCKAASSGQDKHYLAVGTLLHQIEKYKSEYDRLTKRLTPLKALFSSISPYVRIERKLFMCFTL